MHIAIARFPTVPADRDKDFRACFAWFDDGFLNDRPKATTFDIVVDLSTPNMSCDALRADDGPLV